MKGTKNKSRKAFTLIELLVVIAVIVILAGLIDPGTSGAKAKAQRISCVSNLKSISMGWRLWATDNGSMYPFNSMQKATNAVPMDIKYAFLMASNEIGSPKILVCPSDNDKNFATNWMEFEKQGPNHPNISYFVDQDANPSAPLAMLMGDRSLLSATGAAIPKGVPGAVTLTLNSSNYNALDWNPKKMHQGAGNVALADGSVQQVNRDNLRKLAGAFLDGTTNQMRLIYPGY